MGNQYCTEDPPSQSLLMVDFQQKLGWVQVPQGVMLDDFAEGKVYWLGIVVNAENVFDKMKLMLWLID